MGSNHLKILYLAAYLFVAALVIYFRCNVLQDFGFIYTDSDQSIMWEALRNYSEGKFYEPRFYGQAYNTFLEALFAVPLYQRGIPPFIALPLITSVLSLFPYFLLSAFTFVRRSYFHALVILSIPLMLPLEHSLISTMPRGFVTGLFIAALGCVPAFFETNKFGFFAAGLFAVIAFSVNSNAVLLSAPCLMYLFISNLKNRQFYVFLFAGCVPGLIIHAAIQSFYASHPFYNLHGFVLEFSFGNIVTGLNNITSFLQFNTPLFSGYSFAGLFIFLLPALYWLYRKQYGKMFVALLVPVLIIATLGLNKVHEGTKSLFFHPSRMYLSLPVILAFTLSLFRLRYQPPALLFWLIVPHHLFKAYLAPLEDRIEQLVKPTGEEVVIVTTNRSVLQDCDKLSRVLSKHKVELFVIVNHFYYDVYTHGCRSCFENFPNTLKPNYERRTWRLLEDESRVYKTVMFIDMYNKIADGKTFIKKVEGTADLYLVENNSLKTMQLLDSLGIKYRQFKD